MPPFSTRIDEEGVQINNLKLVDAGCCARRMMALLGSGAYPSRNPQQNMADLKAQIAANEKGVQELRKMVAQFGLAVVQAYMGHVQDNAEESVRRVITRLKDGRSRCRWTTARRSTSRSGRCGQAQRGGRLHRHVAQQTNNFNAPTAVCMAAVLYVFRTLVDDDIPLNAGCLKPLHVIIPPGSMLNPNPPASVVAGNVETSTCITNALFGALGVMAASQCTMNNFTFGNTSATSTTRRFPVARAPVAGWTMQGRSGRWFQRHQRGPDPHDEFTADRPRGAGIPLPGAAGELRDPACRIGWCRALAWR
jgi:5-oxoprolinase (ATP-hydrolysing)